MNGKILIFQRMLVNYRVPIFKRLNEIFGTILCFSKNGPANNYFSLVSNPDFPHYLVPGAYLSSQRETLMVQNVLKPLFKFKPSVCIIEFSLGILTNLLFYILRPFLKYKLVLWSHGYNRKTGFNPESNFLDKIRLWMMKAADGIILYSETDRAIVERYLKNSKKIFVAQNTLDTDRLIQLRDSFENRGKDEIKYEMGMQEKYNLIYVGRLLKNKEPDRLLDVFKMVSKRLNSVELHFVGDGPMLGRLEKMSKNLKVRFWGRVTDDEKLGKLLFGSNLMIIPGYLGLSTVHSFCFDLPVITQKKSKKGPFHSPEIEYLVDNKTGFLIDYGNNKEMVSTITNYLEDLSLQGRLHVEMRKEVRNMIDNICSIDKMMEGFKKALDYIKQYEK